MFNFLLKISDESKDALSRLFFVLFRASVIALIVVQSDRLVRVFKELLVFNDKIHEIYWNTILILLTILIPIAIEIIQSLRKLFPKFGTAIYLYEVVQVSRFYLVLPFFSLSLPLLSQLDSKVGVVLHIVIFLTWITLFWDFAEVLTKSVALLSDKNEEVNRLLLLNLGKEKSYIASYDASEKWSAVWKTYHLLREKWQRKFLLLFWKKSESLLNTGKYQLVDELINNFYENYLSFKDTEIEDRSIWLNERKRWLWFHDKKFSDGKENPYSVYIRLLELYAALYKRRKQALSERSLSIFESGLDRLYGTVKNLIENITRDELKESFDSYFGFFKILREHIDLYIDSESEADREYVASIPIYRPILEYADNYSLQSEAFPKEWQFSPENFDNMFDQRGGGRMRLIWLNHFSNWSRDRIGHGEKEYDSKLVGAVDMLFPGMYSPWIALGIGYRTLLWSNSRIDSLCQWKQSRFFSSVDAGDVYSFDPQKSDEENWTIWNDLRIRRMNEMKSDTAKLIMRLGLFGTAENVKVLRQELIHLGEYPDDDYREVNRKELLDLFAHVVVD